MGKKVVGIIQTRNGNSRMPFKNIAPMNGAPMLWQYLNRVKKVKLLDDIVVATTRRPEDDMLCNLAEKMGIKTYRGSENDLVDRYYWCALMNGANYVVRLCSDNPLIEPEEIDRIIESHIESGADFSSNTDSILDHGYPDGFGAEVWNIETLRYLAMNVSDARYREHPHKAVYENPNKFHINTVRCPEGLQGYAHLKLDVNTPEEYRFIKGIFDKYGDNANAKEYLCSLS